jgi:hypothetical protein
MDLEDGITIIPMLTNFLHGSSTPKAPKSSKHLTIKEKMLLDVANTLIVSTKGKWESSSIFVWHTSGLTSH